MFSPFVFGKIASGDAFTDREEEQKRLSENIRSHINSVLISPRRWGKSSLVLKVGDALQRGKTPIRFCYIDLFNVRTEQEFYSHFAREVLRVSYSKWDERLNSAKRFFKRLTPKFSMGTDPLNDFSVSFDLEETKDAPDEILDLPERICQHRKIELVICLDEFQNIGFFDEPLAFQKKMRAQWQHHKHATYCLYGSKRHMMTELFENKSMPFYKFGDVVFLQKIPEHYWVKYLIDGFARTGKSLKKEIAVRIAQEMENHPYFVQQLAHTIWTRTVKTCTNKEYSEAIDVLLREHGILFQREIDGLTNSQINFLRALCSNAAQLSSAETLKKHKMGSSGNVNRIKSSLVSKEVLDITPQGISFIDPMFKRWFSTIYMKP
jgi:hypothetical protein